MKKVILIAAVVLFGAVAPVLAADAAAPDNALHGKIGYMYDTLHVWRGYLTWGHHSGSNVFMDLDLMGSGFHLEVIGHWANASGTNPDRLGYANEERWDYSPYYVGALETEQPWETRYIIGYRYFNYPSMRSCGSFSLSKQQIGSIDLQEMYAGVAFPRLLGVPGLVPGYAVVKGWPSNSDTLVGAANPNHGTYSGWAHVFMLDYALPMAGLTAETPQQTLNFHVETVFNDGVDPRPMGGYTSSDWTHVLFGISTDFDLGNNVIFTPALYHQVTMEDDSFRGVSPDHDMTWAELTVKYKF
jgi:hypothetical protein